MDDNTPVRTQMDQEITLELETKTIQPSTPYLHILSRDTKAENVSDWVQTLSGEDQDAQTCPVGHDTPVARVTVTPESKRGLLEDDGQSVSWASDQDTLVDPDNKHRSSRHRSRPKPLDLTEMEPLSWTDTRPILVSQPLTGGGRPLVSSRQQEHIANNTVYQDSDETYEPEQHLGRNQHVLGLKYIFERYGYPRRPALQPNRLPARVDEVSGYHDFNDTAPVPPPGLSTWKGQYLVAEQYPRSYLCRFRHSRMQRRSLVERTQEDNLGRDSIQ
jgi:hypothetical protein